MGRPFLRKGPRSCSDTHRHEPGGKRGREIWFVFFPRWFKLSLNLNRSYTCKVICLQTIFPEHPQPGGRQQAGPQDSHTAESASAHPPPHCASAPCPASDPHSENDITQNPQQPPPAPPCSVLRALATEAKGHSSHQPTSEKKKRSHRGTHLPENLCLILWTQQHSLLALSPHQWAEKAGEGRRGACW